MVRSSRDGTTTRLRRAQLRRLQRRVPLRHLAVRTT